MTDYTGTESGCKGRMLTGCRDGRHGWGCPLANPLEDVRRVAEETRSGIVASVTIKPDVESFRRGIAMGGRRSGKTYRMEQTKAVWEMTRAETIGIYGEREGIKLSGHRVWVCPICYSGETGWQVETWNGLFPSLIDRAIQDVAMEHLLEMWTTHGDWCLDLLEMTKEVDRG